LSGVRTWVNHADQPYPRRRSRGGLRHAGHHARQYLHPDAAR
jgi:hypothetical protein